MTQKFTYGLINNCKTVIEVWNFNESYIIICRLNLFNKMKNIYSKWPPLARTQSLNLSSRSSFELCNTSTRKSAAAFQRDRFKLLILQHPLPWTELELPAGLSSRTQGTDNPAVAGDKYSGFHFHFILAFCKSRPNPLGLQIVVQASGNGLQEETSQYWKFKAVSSGGSCRFSSWCVV